MSISQAEFEDARSFSTKAWREISVPGSSLSRKISTVAPVRWKTRTLCENPITRSRWCTLEPARLFELGTQPVCRLISRFSPPPPSRSMVNRSPRRPWKVNFFFYSFFFCTRNFWKRVSDLRGLLLAHKQL